MVSQPPTAEERGRWQRRFAAECNNRAWDLAARPERTAAEVEGMVFAAYAAAYHWNQAGGPVQQARADVTLAHALSLAGQGEEALHYARRCLDFFQGGSGEDWDLAFAHLEMALAAYTVKDAALYAFHFARARELGAAIVEEEDRLTFLEEFQRVPEQR
jgi:hypothetical protein